MAVPRTPEEAVASFVQSMTLEQAGGLRYRGRAGGDFPGDRVFGGLVLAQASMAAARTVQDDRPQHSLHAYFLRAGDARVPIDYEVSIERDGRSFSSRRVEAMQHGEPICALLMSFARPEEGIAHADAMPEVPPPEDVAPAKWTPPPGVKEEDLPTWPVELRPITPWDEVAGPGEDARDLTWVGLRAPLPDDRLLHTAAVVYESDGGSLSAVSRRHGDFLPQASASLDHALWLHRPVRWDGWMLHVTESPAAHSSRALSIRKIYTRDGLHVATMAQEGLFRAPPPGARGHR
jgi:acyl-CoA thioesterase-2